MNYQVVTKTVSAQTIAAVRRRVRIGEVGRAWKPALDLVWEFLRQQEGLRRGKRRTSMMTYGRLRVLQQAGGRSRRVDTVRRRF